LTTKDIIKAVAKKNKLKQLDVFAAIQDTEKMIMDALAKGIYVDLKGFGAFYTETRKDKPEKAGIKFQPSRAFKDYVNGINITYSDDGIMNNYVDERSMNNNTYSESKDQGG